MFANWFKFSRPARPQRRTKRLAVESLEDRRVMATVVALSGGGELLTFDSATPGILATQVGISGLRRGEELVGVDVRPATGELYGVSTKGRIYTLDPLSGVATLKATLTADPTDTTDPFQRLKGDSFGVDFNPVVDRLRVVSDRDQNLRINVDTGVTITDTNLAYATADANNGRNPNVVGSAYENPDNNPATGTLLRGIDSSRDVLISQNPANDGTLTTVGSLGFRSTDVVGFDIGADGVALASLAREGRGSRTPQLYTVDLSTGAATLVGTIGGQRRIEDIAILLPAQPVFAVTTGNNLLSFNSARPDLLTAKKPITGLAAGETIRGIDFRPVTGQLYALGTTGRLYILNTATGAATPTPALAADPTDVAGDPPFTAVNGTAFGVDFNPVVDRLRGVSDADQNLRINVDNGLTITDTALVYAAGDVNAAANPNVVASAYSNNFPGTTSTVLRGIDATLDILVTQNPPNNGTLNTVGLLGVNATSLASFDISTGGNALAALQVEGETVSRLYTINLTSGAATPVGAGAIAGGELIAGMAIAPSVVQFAKAATTVKENGGQASVAIVRSGDTSSPVSVLFATADGTAQAGSDYVAGTATVQFDAGEIAQVIAVQITDDDDVEGNETVTPSLTNPVGGGGATLGRRAIIDLVIADDDDSWWRHRGRRRW